MPSTIDMTHGEYPDWMKKCADRMRDTPLCQLPLPGSHDAGSYGAIHTRSRTQQKSITGQLNAGVRYFDFRIIVDDGVYFSHHGADHSRDNTYTKVIPEQSSHWLFDEIAEFCKAHDGEIVILSFDNFQAHWGNSFDAKVLADFYHCVQRHFGTLLIPVGSSIPTYGECIATGQRVFVIVNDNGVGEAIGWQGTPWIWPREKCLRDRFSDYKYLLHSWATLVKNTISDQQDFLVKQPESNDHRDLGRFWVSQAVLGYSNTDTRNGNSQNYEGAYHLNVPFIEAYKLWWAVESAVPEKRQAVQRPNILLMDFSGVFDDFAADCKSLIQPAP